ncbi:MAG: hypothetical protein ACR2MB_01215 [Acidimicrobiales bacterium]
MTGVTDRPHHVDETVDGDDTGAQTEGAGSGDTTRVGPSGAVAASRRLPWDSKARVTNLMTLGLWAVLVLPLVVALVAVHSPRWFPVADLAQSELRVRDVGTAHTPLIGLAGRIGPWYDPGSHPGPLSFWFLAPVYRLLGASSWAVEASAVTLHALAVGLVLWMAKRRAGIALVAATAAAVAVLTRFYDFHVFLEPWNPYLPVTWWLALLFAVWSVLDGDFPMLVVAVVAGSFCAQTHLPYLGMVGGLVGFTVAALALKVWAARRTHDRSGLVRLGRWAAAASALGAALWTAPLVDQIWGEHNFTRITDSLRNPTEPAAGLISGPGELLRNMDPSVLWSRRDLTGVSANQGVAWFAVAAIVAWLVSVAAAWAIGHRQLLRLHATVAMALVLAAFSASRIYGVLWFYLFLWAWGLLTVMLLATGWTAVAVACRRAPALRTVLAPRPVAAAFAVVTLVVAATFAVGNTKAVTARPDLSADLGVVTAQTVAALREGRVPGGGRSGHYLVRWVDRVTIGSQGFGLVNELARAGLDVGVDPGFAVGTSKWRKLDPTDATAVVQLVTGPDIPAWDAKPGAIRVGYVDARSRAELARYRRLVPRVAAELRAAGLADVARDWTLNLFTSSLDPRIPTPIHEEMKQVLDIVAPVAVYVLPVSAAG